MKIPDKLTSYLVKRLPKSVLAAPLRQWACQLALRLAEADALGDGFLDLLRGQLRAEDLLMAMTEVHAPASVRYVHGLAVALYPELAERFVEQWHADDSLPMRFGEYMRHRSQVAIAAEIAATICGTLRLGGDDTPFTTLLEDFPESWWTERFRRETRPQNVSTAFNWLFRLDHTFARQVFDQAYQDPRRSKRLYWLIHSCLASQNPQIMEEFARTLGEVAPDSLAAALEPFWSPHGRHKTLWSRFLLDVQFIQNPRTQGMVLSSLAFVGCPLPEHFRRSLIRSWVRGEGGQEFRLPARLSLVKSPGAIRHLLQAFACWNDYSVYEAIASVDADRLVKRIQEGAIDDLNEAVRLLRALTAMVIRTGLKHDAAGNQTLNRVKTLSERIAFELYQHVTGLDRWGIPRLEQSPWLLQVDLPRLIDVLGYWSQERASELLRRVAQPHVIKAILQGQRLYPYSETILNFGWLARVASRYSEPVAIDTAPPRWGERVSAAVKLWATLWLRHTKWRDDAFIQASEEQKRRGLLRRGWEVVTLMLASLEREDLLAGDNKSLELFAEADPAWLEVALEAALISPNLRELIRRYLPRVAENMELGYWTAHLEASRVALLVKRL
ncbi:MAG: hypothetical protein HXY36_00965 [Chloroflexi bacterium]|nr:hypothetical protein [Chloroflexota bacterium]